MNVKQKGNASSNNNNLEVDLNNTYSAFHRAIFKFYYPMLEQVFFLLIFHFIFFHEIVIFKRQLK